MAVDFLQLALSTNPLGDPQGAFIPRCSL